MSIFLILMMELVFSNCFGRNEGLFIWRPIFPAPCPFCFISQDCHKEEFVISFRDQFYIFHINICTCRKVFCEFKLIKRTPQLYFPSNLF